MEGYIAEVRMFGGNFAPRSWVICNGQPLDINTYTTLYSLISTNYGGDGVTTFNVPNLASRVAVGTGQGPGLSNYTLAQQTGTEQVTLAVTNMPAHTHVATITTTPVTTPSATATLNGSAGGGGGTPAGSLLGVDSNADLLYAPAGGALTPMASTAVALNAFFGPQPNVVVQPAGTSTPHNNLQPYTAINYIICVEGIYPSRN